MQSDIIPWELNPSTFLSFEPAVFWFPHPSGGGNQRHRGLTKTMWRSTISASMNSWLRMGLSGGTFCLLRLLTTREADDNYMVQIARNQVDCFEGKLRNMESLIHDNPMVLEVGSSAYCHPPGASQNESDLSARNRTAIWNQSSRLSGQNVSAASSWLQMNSYGMLCRSFFFIAIMNDLIPDLAVASRIRGRKPPIEYSWDFPVLAVYWSRIAESNRRHSF